MKDYIHEFKKDALLLINDLPCERQVLGSLMSETNAYNEYSEMLNVDSFYSPKHQAIFKAIQAIEEGGGRAEFISVAYEVLKYDKDITAFEVTEIFGENNFSELHRNVLHLQDLENRRKLAPLHCKLFECATTPNGDHEDVIEEVQKALTDICSNSAKKVATLLDCYDLVNQRINDNLNPGTRRIGTMTGYDMLDGKGGFNGGDFIVIAAGTSQGKTSFATSIMCNAVSQGKRVMFYSMEMTKEQVGTRIASMLSGISCNIIWNSLHENQVPLIDKSFSKLGQGINNMFVDDEPNKNIEKLVASIRSMKIRYGIDGVVIDYLQMMNCNLRLMTKEQAMADAARRLKNIAKALDIWIIALSQLNRDSSDDGAPSINKIRDSGQIAEAADVVMTLYRPEVFKKDFPKPFSDYDTKGLALVKIEKGRNIGIGEFLCGFDAETTKFFQLDPIELENRKKNYISVHEEPQMPF